MAIIITAAAFFCLFSCAPPKRGDALDILKLPAELTIEGVRNGVGFCAVISLGSMRADGTRSGEIVFSAPDAFEGLRVRTDSGIWEAETCGVKISGKAAEALGAPLTPFMQSNNAAQAELIRSEDGETQTLITVPTTDGILEYIIDSESGVPIRLREKNGSGGTVMEYKITEYKITKTN